MRVVIQKVKKASVKVDGEIVSSIENGLLILLGIEDADTEEDIEWLVKKVVQLRIFNDENGVMNLSVQDVAGDVIVVSQFTLFANTKKGNRPSYIRSSNLILLFRCMRNLSEKRRKCLVKKWVQAFLVP